MARALLRLASARAPCRGARARRLLGSSAGSLEDLLGPRRPRRPPPDVPLTPAPASASAVPHAAVESPAASRALRCCLVGPTNAGKSTLANALARTPVSIVSDKIHTTRENTQSFVTDEDFGAQVEVVDAPGALGPAVPILQRAIWSAVQRAQLTLVVVDAATRPTKALGRFLGELSEQLAANEEAVGVRSKTCLVLNKVDLVRPKAKLLEISAAIHEWHAFDWPCVMVSAKTGSGIDHLRGWLMLHTTAGEWSVPAHTAHVHPPLQLATELIRAEIFASFNKARARPLSHRPPRSSPHRPPSLRRSCRTCSRSAISGGRSSATARCASTSRRAPTPRPRHLPVRTRRAARHRQPAPTASLPRGRSSCRGSARR